MNDPVFASGRELAAAIRRRQISVREVLAAYLAQIARYNPVLNAIVTLNTERAFEEAERADAALGRGELWGPLHGIPVTIKDTIETRGIRTTAGFPPLADYVPKADATVVRRLRAAGAIVLGKTNTPSLAEDFQTYNEIFGRSNNPWDGTRTPGGSTGGGAAAVAAGLTALELGSDIGGSVRHPAHCCGVYALKPTDHRVPMTGHIPELPGAPRGIRHMGTIGPLARSVEDLALALSLIAGPDGSHWEIPPVPLDAAPDLRLSQLSIAWVDSFEGVPVTRDTTAVITKLANGLEALGARVVYGGLQEFDFTAAWETFGELIEAEVGSTVPPEMEVERAARFGAASEVPSARGMARRVQATMRQYTETLTKRDALIGALEKFFEEHDALLCPVAVGPAFAHCPRGTPLNVDEHVVPYWIAGTAYCNPFNLTGHPAVVLPPGRSAEGLPIGVQLVGRRWGEMKLLEIAAQVTKRITGPFQCPPGYGTGAAV